MPEVTLRASEVAAHCIPVAIDSVEQAVRSFDMTLDAWPVIIFTIEAGRSPQTLAFDAIMIDGTVGLVSVGPCIEMWARYNNGEPNP